MSMKPILPDGHRAVYKHYRNLDPRSGKVVPQGGTTRAQIFVEGDEDPS
jgi:hypothetical protein